MGFLVNEYLRVSRRNARTRASNRAARARARSRMPVDPREVKIKNILVVLFFIMLAVFAVAYFAFGYRAGPDYCSWADSSQYGCTYGSVLQTPLPVVGGCVTNLSGQVCP